MSTSTPTAGSGYHHESPEHRAYDEGFKYAAWLANQLITAAEKALTKMGQDAVAIDGEWGDARSFEQLMEDDALGDEYLALETAIIDCREAFKL